MINVVDDFLDDPNLLGPSFVGSSWDTWRTVLRAAFAQPLTAAEVEVFRAIAGDRRPPAHPVNELDCIAGRGAGKDSIAAGLACFMAVVGDFSRLRPGEHATVLCLAVDRDQAQIVFGYIRAHFEQVPMLAGMVRRITADTVDLVNGAQIVVGTNSYRAVRGRTICCAIFDECCYWRSDDGANPDVEVDAAVAPGLARWPGSLKILISSPYRRSGLLFRRWRESFGKDDDDCLVVHGTTRQFNPLFPQAIVDRELKKDRERAQAEYLAMWRDDLSSFIGRDVVEACVAIGCHERGRVRDITYHAFCDPSSGRGADSMALAIGHKARDGRAILDLVRELRPPFSPKAAAAEFAGIVKGYGLCEITKDAWAVGWVDQAFLEHGITCKASEQNRSEIYLELLPALNSGQVELLDNERLINQLCSLERRVARSGKDSINHPDGGHDDVVNAAAGALVLAAAKAGLILITAAMLARARERPPPRGYWPRSFVGSAGDWYRK
jgi:hypothetical protein